MTRERTRHSSNGRVYVEGTVVEADEPERRARMNAAGAIIPALIMLVIGALVARRLMRGSAA